MGEFNVNKSDGSLEQTAGMPETYPADQVMLSDGVTSVEDALDDISIRLVAQSSGTGTYKDNLNELATAYNNLSTDEKNNSFLIIGADKFYGAATGRFTRLPIFYNNAMALACANISQTPANTNLYDISITTAGTTFSDSSSLAGRKIYLYAKTK